MATRKSTVKPTIVEEVVIEQQATSQAELADKPVTRREIVAAVADMVTSICGIYWGTQTAQLLAGAVLVFTGSAFLSFVIYFLMALYAIIGALRGGAWIRHAIIDGSIESKVSGWYSQATLLLGIKGVTT